jgi:hypothetical protein
VQFFVFLNFISSQAKSNTRTFQVSIDTNYSTIEIKNMLVIPKSIVGGR